MNEDTPETIVKPNPVHCRCCDDEFPIWELLRRGGYCEMCDPDCDIYADPEGNLDFGGEHGEG